MQVTDEQKRVSILAAAAELFAEQPFHKVVLSSVAEKAGVGKGTLYIYFKNKEDLYLSVLLGGFASLVDRLVDLLGKDGSDPLADLERVIRQIVEFAIRDHHIYQVMRTVPVGADRIREQWLEKHMELKSLIQSIIQKGIDTGIFTDTDPELTARYIPGFVRSALLRGVEGVDPEALSSHIFTFVQRALTNPEPVKG